MNYIDNLMRESFGATGRGESTKSYVPRKFNVNRYTTLYAELSNLELRVQAESLITLNKMTKYKANMENARLRKDKRAFKAYSEGFKDMMHTIANKGRDAWRVVKKLLGKLIIYIEEQLHYIFDKSKFADKLVEKLAKQIGNFAKWANPIKNVAAAPSVAGILPDNLERTKVEWFREELLNGKYMGPDIEDLYLECDMDRCNNSAALNNALDDLINNPNLFEDMMTDDIFVTINRGSNIVAALKVVNYWRSKGLSTERKLKELSKDYKDVAKIYREYVNFTKKGELYETLVDGGSSKLPEEISLADATNSVLSRTTGSSEPGTVEPYVPKNPSGGGGSAVNAVNYEYNLANDLVNDDTYKNAKITDPKVIKDLMEKDPNLRAKYNYRMQARLKDARKDHHGKDIRLTGESNEFDKIRIEKTLAAFKESKEVKKSYKEDLGVNAITGRNNADSPFIRFVEYGAILEAVTTLLSQERTATIIRRAQNFTAIFLEGSNYGKEVLKIYNDSKKVLICMALAINVYRNQRDMYFIIKKRANELRNAPTEITDRYPTDVIHGVKKLIGRTTKASHAFLKYCSSFLSLYGDMVLHVSKVIEYLDTRFRTEYENETVDYR